MIKHPERSRGVLRYILTLFVCDMFAIQTRYILCCKMRYMLTLFACENVDINPTRPAGHIASEGYIAPLGEYRKSHKGFISRHNAKHYALCLSK